MIGPGLPGQVMEAFAEGFACGQAGTLTVTIDDGDGNNVLPQTTANIIELECGDDGFAVYRYLGVFPSPASDDPYLITWEGASASDPGIDTTASEEIEVSAEAPAVPSDAGPCTDWITEDDVAACCGVEASTGDIYTEVIPAAQQLLYSLSGGLYSGLCGPVTVRPPCDCSCWGSQRLAYANAGGYRYIWAGSYWNSGWDGSPFGCCGVSRVKLSGYPVQAINQVKIDGAVIAPSDYRLDENRYLTRMNNGRWPACQDMTLEDDQEGTFSISYYYGSDPPALGVSAAAQLACEFYKECKGQTCALPKGTTRITRQGITVERMAFTSWGWSSARGWATGMPLVDAFLNSVNPGRLLRRPVFWAPGKRYARPVG